MPYYTHPDYRIYEFNKKLLQRTEVCCKHFILRLLLFWKYNWTLRNWTLRENRSFFFLHRFCVFDKTCLTGQYEISKNLIWDCLYSWWKSSNGANTLLWLGERNGMKVPHHLQLNGGWFGWWRMINVITLKVCWKAKTHQPEYLVYTSMLITTFQSFANSIFYCFCFRKSEVNFGRVTVFVLSSMNFLNTIFKPFTSRNLYSRVPWS